MFLATVYLLGNNSSAKYSVINYGETKSVLLRTNFDVSLQNQARILKKYKLKVESIFETLLFYVEETM